MINWTNEKELIDIIINSKSKTEVLYKLGLKNNGGNYNTLTSYINLYNIDISHFKITSLKKSNFIKTDLDDALVEKSNYKSTNHLKKRLYKEGIKTRECELCGQNEIWKNKKMSLILDHINGVRNDNRIENLRIVCPNCNATLETHCRGSKKIEINNINKTKHKKCENNICSNLVRNKSKLCLTCYNENRIDKKNSKNTNIGLTQRTKIRPLYEELIVDIMNNGFVKTGEKYGVSDNSIRKWVRYYIKYENKENVLNIKL